MGCSLMIAHSMGLVGRRRVTARDIRHFEPITQSSVITAIILFLFGFLLSYMAIIVRRERELRDTSPGEFCMAVFITTALITLFAWFFLDIHNQIINRTIIANAVITPMKALLSMPPPKDEVNG